mmetsp:Transcript_157323/g.279082  ORF Transcript_157323/g.279082 Transcript_157323/m.279082 type:complete len:104 (+) Transcript_157323:155-466(+)
MRAAVPIVALTAGAHHCPAALFEAIVHVPHRRRSRNHAELSIGNKKIGSISKSSIKPIAGRTMLEVPIRNVAAHVGHQGDKCLTILEHKAMPACPQPPAKARE